MALSQPDRMSGDVAGLTEVLNDYYNQVFIGSNASIIASNEKNIKNVRYPMTVAYLQLRILQLTIFQQIVERLARCLEQRLSMLMSIHWLIYWVTISSKRLSEELFTMTIRSLKPDNRASW